LLLPASEVLPEDIFACTARLPPEATSGAIMGIAPHPTRDRQASSRLAIEAKVRVFMTFSFERITAIRSKMTQIESIGMPKQHLPLLYHIVHILSIGREGESKLL
jgi:hypothetical protein